MVPIGSEEATGPGGEGAEPADPLRRAVQVALAIYLLPVIAIVCAIGGVAIAFDRATGLATRFVNHGRPAAIPGHLPIGPPGETRPTHPKDWRRTRAGR